MNNNYKYFMFSATDAKSKAEIAKKIGKDYHPGEVLTNGIYKQFTEIVDNPTNTRFTDSVIVTSGDIREMIYYKTKR